MLEFGELRLSITAGTNMSVAARTTMEIKKPGKVASTAATMINRAGIVFSALVLVAVVIGVIYNLWLANGWYNQPFLGVMTSRTLVVNGTSPLQSGTWPGLEAGLRPYDQILAVNNMSFEGQTDPGPKLNQLLATIPTGMSVPVKVFRLATAGSLTMGCPQSRVELVTSEGVRCNYSVILQRVPLSDFLFQFGVGFVCAIVLLILGTLLWLVRRRQPMVRWLVVICGIAAYAIVGRFEIVSTFQTGLYWSLAICLLAGALSFLTINFPYELVLVRRLPVLRLYPVVLTVIGAAACIIIYQQSDARSYDTLQLVAMGFAVFAMLTFVASLLMRHQRSSSPVLRDQAAIALVGAALTCAPALLWLLTILIERIGQQSGVNLSAITFSSVYVLPPFVIFPFALSYSILQYGFLDADAVISEGMIYSALGIMVVLGYLLVTSAAFVLTNGVIQATNPIIIAVTLFIIAVVFTPARLRLERLVDTSFFRQRRAYESRLEQFARSLTQSVELNDTIARLKLQLDDTAAPKYLFIFLRNLATGEYLAYADPAAGLAQTDIHFSSDSPLVQVLEKGQPIIYIETRQMLMPELVAERARLAVLNTPVIVRLRSLARLNGFMALGPRQDGSGYQHEDLRFIQALAEQTATAVERAQMVIEAQRTTSELRVLAQVSAALNIVMEFDTLLEFIYTQSDKVINAPNFYVALRDEQQEDLYYAFYQEEGERLPDREGYRWRLGRDLMSEVVRTGQPLKTDNYVQEMNRRDSRLHVENSNLRAWMGVPLNAGLGSALGCLAISTTDSSVTYSDDQMRIFWNIADLAATAIYKTRLFSQTEERARQMKALNDISSRLASEFENLDALLQVITESAVEILRGEAGSLLLREELSGDLIFQLAVGGSGQELVGSRIPSCSGIAGTVVQTGRHVIVNDTQQDNRWFGEVNKGKPDKRQFATRAILADPLTTRAGVIGVLEVINKRDGTAFVEDEMNLLTPFAGQAAVAIEKARFFQMTYKALAERVQQLDNMQRIDQELNRTLDFQRVVDLTIDNAVRESGADSGALVLVHADPPSLEVAGSVGYPESIFKMGETYPTTLGIMGKVFRTGQAALITAMEITSDPDYMQMLPGGKGQLAVPLVTGTEVTAILLLEAQKSETFNVVTASFIQGLAEDANTAITNSQLFLRLEEANEARSQFVGFVAHELKNPMASIKGYAEVLLGGMTGALNEQQQNFIAVIRRNVVRMQQLVDDLRDLTAQETGNLTLKMAPVSFTNVIVETLRPQQRAIDEKEQKVVLNYPETLPLVWGDELRLIQVMTNFVSNANKYTPPSGTITIMAEHVPNQWDPNGAPEVVHCAVTDTGIGMSEEDQKKLFTPYWRSDNPRAKEQPGTGLGMTLTRGLIEAHGGKIWGESTLDVGR